MAERKSNLHPTMCLNPHPARQDLTDRECAKIIGGLVGSLVQLEAPESVRRALKWWAGLSDEQWAGFMRQLRETTGAIREDQWT